MPDTDAIDYNLGNCAQNVSLCFILAASGIIYFETVRRRCRRLKGIHSRPDTNRTGAEGLFFYYPRLLHCLDQMLAVMSLSQHRVSSSKTIRPLVPCGARCKGKLLVHGPRFALRRHTRNSVKVRDPICAWTNGIAQHQSAGG